MPKSYNWPIHVCFCLIVGGWKVNFELAGPSYVMTVYVVYNILTDLSQYFPLWDNLLERNFKELGACTNFLQAMPNFCPISQLLICLVETAVTYMNDPLSKTTGKKW